MHGRGQKANFLSKFFANAFDAAEQVALAVFVDQRDQAVAQLQAQQVHRLHVVPAGFAVAGWRDGSGLWLRFRLGLFAGQPPGQGTNACAKGQKHPMGHAGNEAQQGHDGSRDTQNLGRLENLLRDLLAHVLVFAHTGHHHGGSHRNEQRRNLRHQCITHGQQDVGVCSGTRTQPMLQHADGESAHDADEQNQNARDGIAAYEFGCTVHGAEETRFVAHFTAAALGFFFVNQAGIQVGIDGHLFAGHGVQGEACRHLGNALGALGHHNEVDDHQDHKHDQAYGKVAANQEVAEGLDHRARCTRACVPFQQHHTGRGHVE